MQDFDVYSDNWDTVLNGTLRNISEVPTPIKGYGSTSTFIRGCLVLLLRAGFVLIQLGSIPIENVYIILLQNIVDVAVTIASFGLVGYILAFGYDALYGTVGYGLWIISDAADLDNAVFGFCACIISTGIITTILAGRLHFAGHFLLSFLFSLFFQPIIIHWVWHDFGWLHRKQFLGHLVSVKDHAGGLVIHVTAGLVGFIGALFLGRRLLKLSDIDECSIGPESPGSTIAGYIFISLGFIAFSIPSPSYELTHVPDNYIGLILVNNIMAMAAGIIVVVILQFLLYRETFSYWIILRCLQGAITGIVSIAAGVDVYTPIIAYAIATFASILFYFVAICVYNSSVEDYCNIIPIHLVCGFLGTLLPPVLGTTENLGTSTTSHTRVIHMVWQLLSLAVVCVVVIVIFVTYFFILRVTGLLRNKSEEVNHRRGVTASIRGPERCYLQRLFALYPNTPLIKPGTIGKSPEQYYSHQKVDVPSSISAVNAKFKEAPRSNDPIQISEGTKFDFEPPEGVRKSRLIYTVANVTKPLETDAIEFSSGDNIRNRDGDYGDNSEKLIGLTDLLDATPCAALQRTKKYTNFFSNTVALVCEGVIGEIKLPRTEECIAHDNNLNDGFITIKMPPLINTVNLSDTSEM